MRLSLILAVVCSGLRWFACFPLFSLPIIPNSGGDLWWFAVICGGLWSFAVVCGRLRWFAMVCGGLSYIVIPGRHRFKYWVTRLALGLKHV